MPDISVAKCPDYIPANVQAAVKEALAALGGIEKFVSNGQKVLIKPNLLIKKRPHECTTTHPAVVEAVVREVQRVGGIVTIADSPGGTYNEKALKGLYDITGMTEVAANTGATLNFDVSYSQVKFPQGRTVKAFDIIKPVADADVVINLCKMKTHGMTYITGAVKNMFGAIPGVLKAEYHFRMPDKKVFCDMLVDLCLCTKPALNIMDAVEGMEGSGPSAGTPRHVGAILAAQNAFELDLAAIKIMGVKPNEVFTVINSIERGIIHGSIYKLDIHGDLDSLIIPDYKKPSGREVHFAEGTSSKWLADTLINPKPKVIDVKCVGCGECARVCPAKVITMKNRKPDIDLSKCIRCFCCQELCPHKAMELHRPALVRWFLKGRV